MLNDLADIERTMEDVAVGAGFQSSERPSFCETLRFYPRDITQPVASVAAEVVVLVLFEPLLQ